MGSSQPSQKSTFSFAPQAAKLEEGAFTVANYDWYRHYVPRTAGLAQQMQTVLPLENGSVITATGAYKFGAFVGSEIDIIPRLEDVFGWLLEATMGAVTSVNNANYNVSGFETGHTGVRASLFRFKTDDSAYLPWLAIRRTIPRTSGGDIGEVGWDCKVNNLRFTIPGAGLVTARMGFVGRKFKQESPGAWTYENAFEGSESIPQAGRGEVLMDNEAVTVTGLTVDIMNNLTSVQQEMVVGSLFPDDFVPLTRGCTLRMMLKWSDAELYRRILNGGPSAVEWDSEPFISEISGTVRPFAATFESAADIGATGQPYRLRFFANKVAWLFDGAGIELQAGDILSLPFVGTVLDAGDSSTDYFQIALETASAAGGGTGYTWPT